MIQRTADRALARALRLGDVRSEVVRTPAGRVHVLDAAGTGPLPPLVLLHGLGAGGVHYAGLIRRLRPYVRRILAPDLLGHGLSDLLAPEAEPALVHVSLRDALDIVLDEPAVVFGNSLGGLAAIRYAQARPVATLGLVLVSPAVAPMAPDDLAEFLGGFDLDSHTAALEFADRLFHRPHPLRHLLALGIRARFGASTVRRLLEGATADVLLTPADLADLGMPISIVWGGADRVLPETHRDFFFAHLPAHAERLTPPSFGHAPFLDHADAVADHLLAFARRIDAADTLSALG
jgi:pimeloyl-ACP methyl ester carboxylesterase